MRTIAETKWEPDCQGKIDFDGWVIGIRCRYYPERYRRNIDNKPSAIVTVYYGDDRLISCEVVEDTETQVKAEVERIANEYNRRIADIIKSDTIMAIIGEPVQ